MGRQHQRMDGDGKQGKVEKYCCSIIDRLVEGLRLAHMIQIFSRFNERGFAQHIDFGNLGNMMSS